MIVNGILYTTTFDICYENHERIKKKRLYKHILIDEKKIGDRIHPFSE